VQIRAWDEYQGDGYDLSLRQLYYQMVSRGYLENSQKSYKNLGTLITNARMAGLVDWDMITDRNRETVTVPHWKTPGEIIKTAADSFRVDKWENQPYHVEVMVEKDALSGVLEPLCAKFDVSFTANKGYPSASLLFEMGKRLRRKIQSGKRVVVLHLGDHDPSGIDMTRDLINRLSLFAGAEINLDRLALNMKQIEELKPPENPAKTTDTRYQTYRDIYGESSWELDALEPRSLARLVTEAVEALRDDSLWYEAVKREDAMRSELLDFAGNYEGVGG